MKTTGKRKPNSFSLQKFMDRHDLRCKVPKVMKTVSFLSFVPAWPPSETFPIGPQIKTESCHERTEDMLCGAATKILLNLLTISTGVFSNECPAQLGFMDPAFHEHGTGCRRDIVDDSYSYTAKPRRSDSFRFEFEDNDDEDYRRDIVDDYSNAMCGDDSHEWFNFDWASIMEDLVLPMASSYIHRTSFLPRIKQFRQDYAEIRSHAMSRFTEEHFWETVLNSKVVGDWDREYLECSPNGWSHNVSHLFLQVLECFGNGFMGVISNLELFQKQPDRSVEGTIDRMVWELLVSDWVLKCGGKAHHTRLYGN